MANEISSMILREQLYKYVFMVSTIIWDLNNLNFLTSVLIGSKQ